MIANCVALSSYSFWITLSLARQRQPPPRHGCENRKNDNVFAFVLLSVVFDRRSSTLCRFWVYCRLFVFWWRRFLFYCRFPDDAVSYVNVVFPITLSSLRFSRFNSPCGAGGVIVICRFDVTVVADWCRFSKILSFHVGLLCYYLTLIYVLSFCGYCRPSIHVVSLISCRIIWCRFLFTFEWRT